MCMKNISWFFIFLIIGIFFGVLPIVSKKFLLKTHSQSMSHIFSEYSLKNAPSDALSAHITALSGDVLFQSRISTESGLIRSPQAVQQGENVITKKSGNVTVEFPSFLTIHLFPNTELDFVQTLPLNIVIAQSKGRSTYAKSNSIPISIRSFDLLINQTTGVMTVIVNENTSTVTVTVGSGSVKLAYEDLQNNIQLVSLSSQEMFIFDNKNHSGSIQ